MKHFKIIFFVGGGIIFLLAVVVSTFFNQKAMLQENEKEFSQIFIDDKVKIKAEILRTTQQKIKGLSGRENLPQNQGALFVYEKAAIYHFWMKEMNFALDIIWIGSDFKIVDITHNAKPESFPERFAPKSPAQYVLEVNAGFAKKYGIDIGSNVKIEGL